MRRFIILFLILCSFWSRSQSYFLFIGTYTKTGSKGIYVYTFDAATGRLQWKSNTRGIVNPSFLSIAPNKQFLYACTETKTEHAGSVSAFAFDTVAKALKFINKLPAGGDNPVYLQVHPGGRWLINANYGGGSLSVFSVKENGSLDSCTQLIKYNGKSKNASRQESSHVHSSIFSPDGTILAVCDLGTDKINLYYASASEKEPLREMAVLKSIPGSGPRHLAFHPRLNYFYCLEELSGMVTAYKYKDNKADSIQRICSYSVSPGSSMASSDIHFSPDGLFLYTSNRARENTIAIFSADSLTGRLKLAGHQDTQGEVPRNFTIDPSGNYLLVANQASGTIVVFKRDKRSGLLTYSGETINIPSPSCLQMVPYEK